MDTHLFLPVAGVSVDLWGLIAVGGGVGLLSGIFGVGGGFLLTPLLMFMGIPPTVAVVTGVIQVFGSSASGVVAHWRRQNVDVRMGLLLAAGGVVGSVLGVWLFAVLKAMGRIDGVIQYSYVVFLGSVGALMLAEGAHAMAGAGAGRPARTYRWGWSDWPGRMSFPRSNLTISVIPPLAVGVLGGVLAAIMGVGGGFIMVPLMIYALGMPTAVVVGTSLFQILFVTANVAIVQAATTHTVDMLLAGILVASGMAGAQIGARLGGGLKAEHTRVLLGALVLLVCGKMAWSLFGSPIELLSKLI